MPAGIAFPGEDAMRLRLPSLVVAVTLGLSALVTPAAHADPRALKPRAGEANGSFAFRTANGILPTWDAEALRLTGVSPGRAITDFPATNALVTLPVVAKIGSTTFAAGGFRMTNTDTGDFVSCATPAIDTKARVIDCKLRDGTNAQLLTMQRITKRKVISGLFSTTSIWGGIALRVTDQAAADFLNEELDTNVFSPSVTFATGELTVITEN